MVAGHTQREEGGGCDVWCWGARAPCMSPEPLAGVLLCSGGPWFTGDSSRGMESMVSSQTCSEKLGKGT